MKLMHSNRRTSAVPRKHHQGRQSAADKCKLLLRALFSVSNVPCSFRANLERV